MELLVLQQNFKTMDIQSHFIEQSIRYIEMNPVRLKNCLERLSKDQIWHKPNENTNSIANLVLHLQGNVRQYIIAGLGRQEDNRNRDLEFSTRNTHTTSDLLSGFNQTVDEACSVIKSLNTEELNTIYSIQGFKLSGIEVIIHVTEHLSYHMGQIALLTKLQTNQDLGFYAGLDLNITKK